MRITGVDGTVEAEAEQTGRGAALQRRWREAHGFGAGTGSARRQMRAATNT